MILSENDCEAILVAFNHLQNQDLLSKKQIGVAIKIMNVYPDLDRKFQYFRDRYDLAKGGYINKYGVRVPNPCHEIDMKGRNMDKIYRNLRPEDNLLDEETLDRLNSIEE